MDKDQFNQGFNHNPGTSQPSMSEPIERVLDEIQSRVFDYEAYGDHGWACVHIALDGLEKMILVPEVNLNLSEIKKLWIEIREHANSKQEYIKPEKS